jgi:hypothetical protein
MTMHNHQSLAVMILVGMATRLEPNDSRQLPFPHAPVNEGSVTTEARCPISTGSRVSKVIIHIAMIPLVKPTPTAPSVHP